MTEGAPAPHVERLLQGLTKKDGKVDGKAVAQKVKEEHVPRPKAQPRPKALSLAAACEARKDITFTGPDLAFILRKIMGDPGDPGKKVSSEARALLAELEAKGPKPKRAEP